MAHRARSLAYATLAAALGTCLALAAHPARAQAWKPEKPVEIIIGTSPGGPQDRTGRLIQRILQEQKLAPGPVNVVNSSGMTRSPT